MRLFRNALHRNAFWVLFVLHSGYILGRGYFIFCADPAHSQADCLTSAVLSWMGISVILTSRGMVVAGLAPLALLAVGFRLVTYWIVGWLIGLARPAAPSMRPPANPSSQHPPPETPS